jgi:hypothetical protein
MDGHFEINDNPVEIRCSPSILLFYSTQLAACSVSVSNWHISSKVIFKCLFLDITYLLGIHFYNLLYFHYVLKPQCSIHY